MPYRRITLVRHRHSCRLSTLTTAHQARQDGRDKPPTMVRYTDPSTRARPPRSCSEARCLHPSSNRFSHDHADNGLMASGFWLTIFPPASLNAYRRHGLACYRTFKVLILRRKPHFARKRRKAKMPRFQAYLGSVSPLLFFSSLFGFACCCAFCPASSRTIEHQPPPLTMASSSKRAAQ